MTALQNAMAVGTIAKYGINVKGFFIIGLPGETEKTARKTIDLAKNLKKIGLKKADFYFLTPFPGTPIWNNPKKFAIEITNRDFTKYLEAGKGARCHVQTRELSRERIEELVKIAREEFKNA
jgi:radical SAM superfamily enzyme YgiQ (UPF0313 family)